MYVSPHHKLRRLTNQALPLRPQATSIENIRDKRTDYALASVDKPWLLLACRLISWRCLDHLATESASRVTRGHLVSEYQYKHGKRQDIRTTLL